MLFCVVLVSFPFVGDSAISVLIRLADLWSSPGAVVDGGVLRPAGVAVLSDLRLLPVIVKLAFSCSGSDE